MNSLPASPRSLDTARRLSHKVCSAVLLAACCAWLPAQAATPLADQPVFATTNVPGNLALVLSVEFPTAISVAHTNRTYVAANQYLGYFDPDKCYSYRSDTDTTSVNNYFQPDSLATNHVCSGKWSGNFLNWATMQTIDPFRWALTGGYRVIDTATLTVVEKAWGTNQGGIGNFPDSSINATTLAGATPFGAPFNGMNTRIWSMGNKMRFSLASNSFPLKGDYFNNTTLSGTPVVSRTDADTSFITGGVSPAPGVGPNNYSVRWTGTVTAPQTGVYSFRTNSDDGVRLYVNGSLVIDNYTPHAPTNDFGLTGIIAAGTNMNIVLEYFQAGGGATINLAWLPPGATAYSAVGASTAADLGTAPATYTGGAVTSGGTYEAFVRVKTCDANVGIEANCVKYGSNYKPEGLMQKYSSKIRYSAFGYLNDGNILRDGGVLRARQKFIGPTQPVPGSADVVNRTAAAGGPTGQVTGAEWSATDGTFTLNPDATDAANTASVMGGLPAGFTIGNSGVLNYLNKFGEVTANHSYKTYDDVSELYYAATRYFKNLGPVDEWTARRLLSTDADAATWTDGFPVIKNPADPILYSCQRNFILGIGDVNTHADKDVPGNTIRTNEPTTMPVAVGNDNSVDAVDATNKVGVLESLGTSLGTVNPYNGCCNNNSALIAGLAYDAHVKDIRGRSLAAQPTPQTIDTYWVDVQENQVYKDNNQFYLATKYGGFTVPTGYSMSNTTALPEASWHTNTDTFGNNKRPDNYFSGGQPDKMKAGLDAAFGKIASALGAFTTSFSTSLPQIATVGNSSFSSQFDPKDWSGEVTASNLSFDTTASTTTLTTQWTFSARLAAQLAGNGWDANRRMLTWNGSNGVAFRATGATQLASTDLAALNTSYVSGDDKADYLNYLRGDQSNEVGSTVSTSKLAYRARTKLIGDIVGSKAQPVGPPSFPFSDSTNPGYASFKSTWATRRTVVYVGANDGMMHAINGALAASSTATPPLESDANYGKEMFAYVPRSLFQGPTAPNTDGLASLGNPAFTHHYMVNATPSVNDVDFARVPNASKVRQNPVSTTYDWRSVLIGGLGKGGKAYYAIDVTDPVSMATTGTEDTAASKVLWEFSNATTGMGGELGYTFGDPLVMKTAKYGWVVVLTSGYNNSDGVGYFFFVNPKTGALLEKVSTGAGSTTSDAGLARANAFIVDYTDDTADAIYAGDLLGNLWRLDVRGTTGSYPAPVAIARLTDASAAANPQPVTSRPSIEVSLTLKKRFVMVGTGRLLDPSDAASTQGQTFYTIADGTNAAFNATPFAPATTPAYPITRSQLAQNVNVTTTTAVPGYDPATQVGWFEELGIDPGTPADPTASPPVVAVPSTGIAWRIVSDLTTALGSVAFAPTLPSGSVCSPSGISSIYARDFSTGQSTLADYAVSIPLTSTATDLRYLSVAGKLRLVAGTEKGGAPKVIPIQASSGFSLRRLNWRELQVVD